MTLTLDLYGYREGDWQPLADRKCREYLSHSVTSLSKMLSLSVCWRAGESNLLNLDSELPVALEVALVSSDISSSMFLSTGFLGLMAGKIDSLVALPSSRALFLSRYFLRISILSVKCEDCGLN